MDAIWILFIPFLVIFYTSSEKKIKRLNKRIKRLEKQVKGNQDMSRLLEELKGQTRRLYDLAAIFKGVMIVPYLLVIYFSCQKLVYEEKLTGTLGKYTIPLVFLGLLLLTFGLEHQFRKMFKQIYGKAIPRNASGAEVRELMMSMMDEAEKQICYEENFDIVFKLSNYVLPISLMAIFLVGITFQADILLALVVVSLIYVYILVSQYKITKRYYKE